MSDVTRLLDAVAARDRHAAAELLDEADSLADALEKQSAIRETLFPWMGH
jgi:hypothetical protein